MAGRAGDDARAPTAARRRWDTDLIGGQIAMGVRRGGRPRWPLAKAGPDPRDRRRHEHAHEGGCPSCRP